MSSRDPVHILLPPSEGKTSGGRGRPLRTRTANGPLAGPRADALDALATLVAGDPDRAAEALLLPRGVAAAALEVDARVRDSPTTPALRRYAGVVYDGLDAATLSAAEQRLAGRSMLIFSGLFGVVRGDEAVPEYRVPGRAVLPGLGVASTFWRRHLQAALREVLRRGLVVDLRSGDYAAMWRPERDVAPRTITVRVLSRTPRGGHAVVSYTSKLAKGRLARALVQRAAAGGTVTAIADVIAAWDRAGGAGHEQTSPTHLDLRTD